jgi:hypothetical protein
MIEVREMVIEEEEEEAAVLLSDVYVCVLVLTSVQPPFLC